MNPWWSGGAPPPVPPMRRWAFGPVLDNLRSGLTPATVLRGPRQVGKTSLMDQVIAQLLADGVAPSRILKLQFDDIPDLRALASPVLELPRWYAGEVLGKKLTQAAAEGQHAYVFLDEVQNLADWSPQLKHLVDVNKVRVLVTGSSALRIEAGRDSLAGRITTIEMGPLLLREIGELRGFGRLAPHLPHNGVAPMKDRVFWEKLRFFGEWNEGFRQKSFRAFSERGAYPVAQAKPDVPWERMADQLNETVVKRAIQHDLRLGPKGKKRDECDHALCAAWLEEAIPLTPEGLDANPHLSMLAGHIAESVVGYFFKSILNLDVAHFPERGAEREVDFVLTIGEQRIPVEVKYRRHIDHEDTRGLRAFVEKSVYNAPFGVLVTLGDQPGSDDPRIVSIPLSTLLLMR